MRKLARVSKRQALKAKIAKAEERVLSTKAEHEKAVEELKALLDEQKELETKELMTAIEKSGKSYEEILRLINL